MGAIPPLSEVIEPPESRYVLSERDDLTTRAAPAKPFQAVVEIVAEADGKPPIDLLRAIYRASAFGVIVLALQNISPQVIDGAIDDIVRELPLSIPGLLYVDATDRDAVVSASRSAEAVIISTIGFRSTIDAWGIDPRLVLPAMLVFGRLRVSRSIVALDSVRDDSPAPVFARARAWLA